MSRPKLLLFVLGAFVSAQITAQVELISSVVGVTDEGVIHRVWLSMPDGGTLQSIYADGLNPMTMVASEGVFQSDENAILDGSGAMDAVDSWFTLGEPSGPNSTMTTGGAQWNAALSNFESGSGFVCDDDFGGAFFLFPGATQGQAIGGQVLLAQIVSQGTVDLQLNAQWQASLGGDSQYAEGLSITLSGSMGCMDSGALNFNPDALQDDGSCIWFDGAGAELVFETIHDATGVYPPTYRVYAELDNTDHSVMTWFGTPDSPISLTSSAEFIQIEGGTAQHPGEGSGALLDRDSWLSIGDEPGAFFIGVDTASFESGLSLTSDQEFGGAVGLIPGDDRGTPDNEGRVLLAQLTTLGAVSFSTNLKLQLEGSATADVMGLSLSIPAFDTTISGCTDPAAPNYLPQATTDDGSCLSGDVSTDPVDGFIGLIQESTSSSTDTLMVHRVYAQFDGAGFEVLAMFGTQDSPLQFTAEDGFHQDPSAGPLATDLPSIGAVPTDSWLTIGGEGPGTVSLYSIGMDFPSFESGNDLIVDSNEGGALFIIPGTQPAAVSGADGRVLLAQVASQGMVELRLNLKVETPAGDAPEILGLELVVPPFLPGCMDAEACNYNAGATLSDGSCQFTDGVCQTCVAGQIVDNDADGDGVCDADETSGCTNPAACNYDATATTDTDNDQCIYPTGCQTCSGDTDGTGTVVDNDDDGDGVCNADEIPGCTDSAACNYNVAATDDDGICILPTAPCETCSGEDDGTGTLLSNDADNDGICDEDETEGCTDSAACNYNDSNTIDTDNSQCTYAGACQECSGETNGSGTVIDVTEGLEGCTYGLACNYNPNACQEDGSCIFAEPGRDCEGNCLWDFNGDGTCDEPGMGGCTYPNALNYEESAAYDDGTCEFRTGNCAFDNNEDGEVDVIDLLDMLVAMGTYCE